MTETHEALQFLLEETRETISTFEEMLTAGVGTMQVSEELLRGPQRSEGAGAEVTAWPFVFGFPTLHTKQVLRDLFPLSYTACFVRVHTGHLVHHSTLVKKNQKLWDDWGKTPYTINKFTGKILYVYKGKH